MKQEEIGIEIARTSVLMCSVEKMKELEKRSRLRNKAIWKGLALYLKEFLKLCKREVYTKEMYIVKDYKDQYTIRVPKEFADAAIINPKEDRMLFELTVPSGTDRKHPTLSAELIKGAERKNKPLKNKTDLTKNINKVTDQLLKLFAIKESPFKEGELLIIAIIAQWKKEFTAQELATLTGQNWPTTNRYLENLNRRGFVKCKKDSLGRNKWMFNFDVLG